MHTAAPLGRINQPFFLHAIGSMFLPWPIWYQDGSSAATWRTRPVTIATVAGGEPAVCLPVSFISCWHQNQDFCGTLGSRGWLEKMSHLVMSVKEDLFVFFQAKLQFFTLMLLSNLKAWILSLGLQGGLWLRTWMLLTLVPSCTSTGAAKPHLRLTASCTLSYIPERTVVAFLRWFMGPHRCWL